MGYHKFKKKDLMKALEQVDDDDLIMIKLGGHTGHDYPFVCVEDSTSFGIWELRCDPSISFYDALKQAIENNEL